VSSGIFHRRILAHLIGVIKRGRENMVRKKVAPTNKKILESVFIESSCKKQFTFLLVANLHSSPYPAQSG
jgi:hypothetical protein